ncbi:MAG: hypothetical protein ACRCWJ_13590, partial [Casimicrobium sp.]
MKPRLNSAKGTAATRVAALACALGFSTLGALAHAQEGGFFSGLRLNALNGAQAPGTLSFAPPGLKLGQALEYSRPADSANPLPNVATAFGGYQFGSGLALGAALNSSNSVSPFAVAGTTSRDGVGLRFDASRWTVPSTTSNVNVDVVSAFNYRNYLSVYGKVGVGRTDNKAGEV